ncbi:MAG TPA: NAD-dependent epimerase/dehydratase family protein [Pirellulales bacterium]|nr:NAD-dependent epimerase/dehydratase family protein [Pirellulales bacterium]
MLSLVTGASGFLGRYVVEQLVARGDRVRAFVRRPDARLQKLGVEIVLGDLIDRQKVEAACAQVEAVFHIGGKAGYWGPWSEYLNANVLGTAHVISGCQRHQVRRLIYTSSPSVTFAGADQCDLDESAPYPERWLSPYPQSKAIAEQAVLLANGEAGVLTCALRPHLIWGPGDRHLIPRLIARAQSGLLRRVGTGQNRVDTTYVENAAIAHLQAADALRPGSTVAGSAYFISQGEPVNCWAWINAVLSLVGLPPVKKSISSRLAYLAGASLESIYKLFRLHGEPPMTRFLAAQLSRSHYYRIDAARRDFGFEPQITTDEGMRRLQASLLLGTADPRAGHS